MRLMTLVVSVTQIHTGSAENIIPDTAYINGTIRSFDKDVQQMVWTRLSEIVDGQAASYGVTATLRIDQGYPATVNDPDRVEFAAEIAREIAGEAPVITTRDREMGAEDFSFMLNERPEPISFWDRAKPRDCITPVLISTTRWHPSALRSLPVLSNGRNR